MKYLAFEDCYVGLHVFGEEGDVIGRVTHVDSEMFMVRILVAPEFNIAVQMHLPPDRRALALYVPDSKFKYCSCSVGRLLTTSCGCGAVAA